MLFEKIVKIYLIMGTIVDNAMGATFREKLVSLHQTVNVWRIHVCKAFVTYRWLHPNNL